MTTERKSPAKFGLSPLFATKPAIILLAAIYIGAAAYSAWNIVAHTKGSTDLIEKVLLQYNMKNEGAQAVDRYTKEHPFLGGLFGSPVKKELKLPSTDEADQALGPEVKTLLKGVRQESSKAAWWSWFFLSVSTAYVVAVIVIHRSHNARPVLFALTMVSLTCFVIGIVAPAMVIWTAPSLPLASGNLEFVLQHQVRGIGAIIWELLTKGHWVIGFFLLLFSIVTPLSKAVLTVVATASNSKALNFRIGELLHSIGKWSMADVFVAGILLSLYALKAQQATKSIPCLGLYYFIGYCMLSMTTTELLVNSGLVSDAKKSRGKLELGVISAICIGAFCFVSASGLYTYQQYTMNTKQSVKATSPSKLNNADLVLPVHKSN